MPNAARDDVVHRRFERPGDERHDPGDREVDGAAQRLQPIEERLEHALDLWLEAPGREAVHEAVQAAAAACSRTRSRTARASAAPNRTRHHDAEAGEVQVLAEADRERRHRRPANAATMSIIGTSVRPSNRRSTAIVPSAALLLMRSRSPSDVGAGQLARARREEVVGHQADDDDRVEADGA